MEYSNWYCYKSPPWLRWSWPRAFIRKSRKILTINGRRSHRRLVSRLHRQKQRLGPNWTCQHVSRKLLHSSKLLPRTQKIDEKTLQKTSNNYVTEEIVKIKISLLKFRWIWCRIKIPKSYSWRRQKDYRCWSKQNQEANYLFWIGVLRSSKSKS